MSPERREPSPYTDRLTLAESFQGDGETRARGEDRTTYHTFADTVVETVAETFRVR